MNGNTSRLPGRPLVLIAAIFIPTLVVGFIFQDWLRETLLVPLLYMFWVSTLAFQSFDQLTIWKLTLVFALILSFVYAVRKAKYPVNSTQSDGAPRLLKRGRIYYWGQQIHIVKNAMYTMRFRYHDLAQLIIKTLMYKENSNRKKILARIRSGELEMPPEVRAIILREETENVPLPQVGLLQQLQQMFSTQEKPQVISRRGPDQKLEKVLNYLEKMTEDIHGF
jgi:Ca2+/Na+ antiporter